MGKVIGTSVDKETGEIVEVAEEMDYDKPAEAEEAPAASGEEKTPEEIKAEEEKAAAAAAEKEEEDADEAAGGKEEKPGDAVDSPESKVEAEEKTPEEIKAEEEKAAAAEKPGEPAAKAGEKPKKKGKLERRLDKLTKEGYEKERRIKELEAEKAARPAQPAAAPRKETAEDKAPKEEDFETYGEFVEASGRHAARQEYAKLEQDKAAAEAAAANKRVIGEHFARVDAARERYDDWDEVAQQQKELPPGVQIFIVQDEAGPDLAYHLAKNPEIAAKLWKMSDVRAVAEVGKIAASLTANDPKAKKPPVPTGKEATPVSNAPKPTKPVGGSGAGKYKLPLDDERVKPAEFDRRREAGEQ